MSAHDSGSEVHAVGSTRLFVMVWIWLAVITFIEVFLAYERLRPSLMLTLLVVLSLVKSALIVSYFMHLKYEIAAMKWVMMTAVTACLCLMCIFFPDAFRVVRLGVR